MTSSTKIARSLLRKLRTVERKLCWAEGYVSRHMPDTKILNSLEEKVESLKELEEQIIEFIEEGGENYE